MSDSETLRGTAETDLSVPLPLLMLQSQSGLAMPWRGQSNWKYTAALVTLAAVFLLVLVLR